MNKLVGRTPSGRHVYVETLAGFWIVRVEGSHGLDSSSTYSDQQAARDAAEFLIVPQCEMFPV